MQKFEAKPQYFEDNHWTFTLGRKKRIDNREDQTYGPHQTVLYQDQAPCWCSSNSEGCCDMEPPWTMCEVLVVLNC